MRIKKGDKVKIMTGKDRGKTGTVLAVFRDHDRLTVENLNVYKKRSRSRQQGKQGEVVNVARPLSISNVALVCNNCGKATRTGFRMEGGRKVRYCKQCESPA